LAGSPKTGKTSFCTQLITQIAEFNGSKIYPAIPLKNKGNNEYPNIEVKQKQAVLFYSLEMSKSDITTKLISQLSGVDYWKIRLNRNLIQTEETLKEAEKKRAGMVNVFIRDLNDYPGKDDATTLNFLKVKAEIAQVKSLTGRAEIIVFIDHLNVFPIDKKEYKDQIEKEGELIKQFNGIALKEGVTMFLISQTNKEAMRETDNLFKDIENAGSRRNYDTFLSAVKGSVDTVYIASGIWSMVKTGREFYSNGPKEEQINGRMVLTQRPPIYVKLLVLTVTERNSPGGVLYLLYLPFKQRFEIMPYSKIIDYCKDNLNMTDHEINNEFLAIKERNSKKGDRQ